MAGRVIPPALLERGVRVGAGSHVGSLVVLASDVEIGAGTTVERSVILNGSQIGENCTLRDCIIAAGCRVGARTKITGGSVLGEGVTVGADNVIEHGARIFPVSRCPMARSGSSSPRAGGAQRPSRPFSQEVLSR